MEIEAFLTEDIIPGCVSLIQGAWSVRDSQDIEKGGAANILTSTIPTLPSQGSRTHSVFDDRGPLLPARARAGRRKSAGRCLEFYQYSTSVQGC